MNDKEVIDFCELERELDAAVAADLKYKRENDAKFRAISQKVASYEEFRDIVLASNLKPLDRKDKLSGERKQPWNVPATVNHSSGDIDSVMLNEELPAEPKNAFEFTRDWRRLKAENKFDYLLQLGAEKLSRIFHPEISSGLLGEFICILEKNVDNVHQDLVLQILEGLAKTQRFDLNLAFLSKAERDSCQKLFAKLIPVNQNETTAADKGDVKRHPLLKKLTGLYKAN
ncbi:coiled-coil domain-containing protein 103 [Bombina bombina]|uniref:coiled-coil domain-containing protein 103 n=1 Tax=Bombina bombina TaxID=8345 RepID=UPI00235A986B|nr:coiled-coil domain-containing protein 103 [Bombina bombina]